MRTGRIVTALLTLAMLMFIAPSLTQAAEVSQFKFKEESVGADFSGVDPTDPCIFNSGFVVAFEGRVKDGAGSPQLVSQFIISLNRFNFCTEEALEAFGSGTLPDDAFQVDNQLRSATLNATVEVCDNVSGSCFPVDIDMTWTGIGELEREKSNFHSDTPDCKIRVVTMGTFRLAVASGSVIALGSNFTPELSNFAQINDSKSGTITIGCV